MFRSLSLKAERTRVLFCRDHAFHDGGDGYPTIEQYAREIAEQFGLEFTVFDAAQNSTIDFELPPIDQDIQRVDYSLLICGGMLEFSVTHAAFEALLEGLEVYILADQIATSQPAYIDHFTNRLRHRSAQFVTSQQAEFEMRIC